MHRVRSYRYPTDATFRFCLPWHANTAARALLDELAPDVVHVQAHFVVGRKLALAASHGEYPLVATNHFMPENLIAHSPVPGALLGVASRWAWRDLARVYRHAAVLTAPTPRAVALLAESAGLPDAVAVSCGIDVARYERPATHNRPDDVPTVLFVGRLDQEKRVDELLRAFAALPVGLPANLEIVGDGNRRAPWTALAARLGITDRTRFRGFVSEVELIEAYTRSAVFCMPGIAELQSIATLEAMAAGTPIVAADAMALPHLVHPGRNGWLYPPGDVGELTRRLEALLADPDLRTRMGAASRDIVGAHAIDTTLTAFESIYRSTLDGQRVPQRPQRVPQRPAA